MQPIEKRCARVTRRGIQLNKQYYSCSLAIREGWFEKAALQGGWKISVYIDSSKVDSIFIQEGDELIICQLIEFTVVESSKLEAYFASILALKEHRKRLLKLKE